VVGTRREVLWTFLTSSSFPVSAACGSHEQSDTLSSFRAQGCYSDQCEGAYRYIIIPIRFVNPAPFRDRNPYLRGFSKMAYILLNLNKIMFLFSVSLPEKQSLKSAGSSPYVLQCTPVMS
jgi:hypothetical protein